MRRQSLFALLLIVVALLAVDPSIEPTYLAIKLLLIRAIAAVGLLFVALSARVVRIPRWAAVWSAGLCLLWAASTLSAGDRLNAVLGDALTVDGVVDRASLLAVFIVLVGTEGLEGQSFSVTTVAALAVATVSLLQMLGVLSLPFTGDTQLDGLVRRQDRVVALVGHPVVTATVCAMLMALLFSEACAEPRRRRLAIVLLSAVASALIGTASRGGWVAAVVALLLVSCVAVWSGGWSAVRRTAGFAMVGVTVLVAVVNRGGPAIARLTSFGHLANDRSWTTRMAIWRISKRIVAEHLMLGVGWGNLALTFPRYVQQGDDIAGWMAPTSAHNIFLDHTVSVGLPAAVFYFALPFGMAGILVVRGLQQRTPESLRAVGIGAAIVAYLIAGISSWEHAASSVIFVVALAMATRSVYTNGPSVRCSSYAFRALAAAVAAILAWSTIVGTRQLVAWHQLAAASTLDVRTHWSEIDPHLRLAESAAYCALEITNRIGAAAVARVHLGGGQEAYDFGYDGLAAAHRQHPTAELPLRLALRLDAEATVQGVIQHVSDLAQVAMTTLPQLGPNNGRDWEVMALFQLRNNDAGAAVPLAERALELGDEDARLMLADSLRRAGRASDALEHYQAIVTARDLRTDRREAAIGMILSFLELHRFSDAVRSAGVLSQTYPRDLSVQLLTGAAGLRAGERRVAHNAFAAALSLDSRNEEARAGLRAADELP